MNLQDLKELSRDRELSTQEAYTPNDFYGHASILKEYCGIGSEYSIKAAIEHAPTFGEFAWKSDIAAQFPSIFSYSRARFSFLRLQTQKSLFAVGSPILYARSLLSEAETAQERARLGKNLLVFPSHSSHHIDVKYDMQAYADKVKVLSKSYDSTRICLYWRDVLSGVAEFYHSQGFECVTAGHMFDFSFLKRLRALIETATVATGPEGGTCVGYCVAFNVPFFITETHMAYDARKAEHAAGIKAEYDQSKGFYDRVTQAFSHTPIDKISPQERDLVNVHWGVQSKKTPEEMRALFEIAEDLYQMSRSAGAVDRNYLLIKLAEYLKNANITKALVAIDDLEYSDPALNGELPLARAAVFIHTGRNDEARRVLQDFIAKHPQHERASKLLALCTS